MDNTNTRTITLQCTPVNFAMVVKAYQEQIGTGHYRATEGFQEMDPVVMKETPGLIPGVKFSHVAYKGKRLPDEVLFRVRCQNEPGSLIMTARSLTTNTAILTAYPHEDATWDPFEDYWAGLLGFLTRLGLVADQAGPGEALPTFKEFLVMIDYDLNVTRIPATIKRKIKSWYSSGGKDTITQQEMAEDMDRSLDTIQRILGTKK